MEVNVQLHALTALSPVKQSLVPIYVEVGLGPELLWILGRVGKYVAPPQEFPHKSFIIQSIA